jgi:hypothetical protein
MKSCSVDGTKPDMAIYRFHRKGILPSVAPTKSGSLPFAKDASVHLQFQVPRGALSTSGIKTNTDLCGCLP